MKNLKYDLFNFKKDLPIEDYELNVIAERYINDRVDYTNIGLK